MTLDHWWHHHKDIGGLSGEKSRLKGGLASILTPKTYNNTDTTACQTCKSWFCICCNSESIKMATWTNHIAVWHSATMQRDADLSVQAESQQIKVSRDQRNMMQTIWGLPALSHNYIHKLCLLGQLTPHQEPLEWAVSRLREKNNHLVLLQQDSKTWFDVAASFSPV